MVQRIAILPDVYLTAVTTDKFKTECISLNLLRPLCREEAAMNALLGGILLRGSKRCPDLTAVSTALEELYGAEIGNLIRRKGEVQCIGLFADCLCDEAVGEPIFAQTVAMAAELLLDPVTDGGVFREDYIAQEKENLIRSIRARMNGKRVYAHTQMVKAMFRDEAFGTMIPRNVRLSEAPSFGLPIHLYDGKCSGTQAYRELAKEVLKRNK